MVRLTRIYTRLGDDGETHLGDMSRVRKDSARVAAFGDVDEANSMIGVALAHGVAGPAAEWLRQVQNDLFDVGADLCLPLDAQVSHTPLRVVAAQVSRLEGWCDEANARLAPLTSFILPGGTHASAHLHLARAVTRRAERSVIALQAVEPVNPDVVRYLNRLSDLLFILARDANGPDGDVLWQPGAGRGNSEE